MREEPGRSICALLEGNWLKAATRAQRNYRGSGSSERGKGDASCGGILVRKISRKWRAMCSGGVERPEAWIELPGCSAKARAGGGIRLRMIAATTGRQAGRQSVDSSGRIDSIYLFISLLE